jgi:hypothetical protein
MRELKKEDATVSLYDYLGYAAGKDNGKDVYQLAMKLEEPVNTREVKTKTYNGKVLLYREQFLKYYFDEQTSIVL